MIKIKFFITICFLLFLFKTNEAILLSLSNAELDKIVEYLKSNEQICTEVIGHTDDVGSENKNQTPGTVINFRFAPIGSTGIDTYSNSKSIMVI
jgi:hypothetical protein